MSQVSKFRRLAAVALSGALIATAVPPAQAMPIPMSRDLSADPVVDTVQYRRGPVRAPARSRVVRRGNKAAGAAAIIGALAIGAAAIAATQQRQRPRAYYNDPYDDGYYGQQQYYQPQPQYYRQPQPQYYYEQPAPQYYRQPAPQYRTRNQPQIDGGSPYAVQQQRVQQPRVQRGGRQYYNGQYLPPGVQAPPRPGIDMAVPIPSNN